MNPRTPVKTVVSSYRHLPRPIGAAFLFALVAAAAACGGSQPPAGAGAPPGGMPPMPVEAMVVAPKPVAQSSEFVGTVKSRQSTRIQPQAEGFLTKISVKSGDRVSAGQTLFEIDSASQQALVANLESVRSARAADVTLAKQRADRAKALLAVGAGTQQDLEAATSALQTAEAAAKSLEEQIRQQRNELSYYHVKAPTAGVVGDVPVRQGDRVTRGTELTTIDTNAGLEIYIGVPVQQAPQLKVGLPIEIESDSGVVTREKVSFVSPSVDDTTQTVLVKAAVVATKNLRTDQFVRTKIVWSTSPAITVPITAVLRINGQYFVYVATSERGGLSAHQRQIKVGPVVGNDYVVAEGLTAGEQVIVSGIQKIGEGAPVQIVPAGAAGGK
ncbi:MAG: efflux RND transporter periplasmic adaptor subunit [Acidobacteria bacterium]|nr:MAG: efflux RND transporter periplasmic adaptor subunit [Acidobacteriota bacterium]